MIFGLATTISEIRYLLLPGLETTNPKLSKLTQEIWVIKHNDRVILLMIFLVQSFLLAFQLQLCSLPPYLLKRR